MAVEPFLATKAQRAFIAAVTIQTIVVLVIIGITFRMTLPCYLAVYAFAEVFELFMVFDALRLRNIIQLFGILIFHLALVIGAVLQIRQAKTALVTLANCDASVSFFECGGSGTLFRKAEPLLIAPPCVIAASWLFMLFLFKPIYTEFGWDVFQLVGADLKMKTMFQWYQIMICLLKFDFFFFNGVTMQLIIIVLQVNSAEFGVTIAAIPIVLVLLVFCGLAVQREIKSVMILSLAMMAAVFAYFVYKLVRFYEPSSRAAYETTRATLTTFTIITLILLLGTFAVGVRCFLDFDRGLQSSKLNSILDRRGSFHSRRSSGNIARDSMSQNIPPDQSGAPIGPRLSIE